MSVSRGSPEPVRVLVLDDDPAQRRLLAAAVASLPGSIVEDARTPFAAAVMSLDTGDAADVVAALRRNGFVGPVIAISKQGSLNVAIDAIRAGADDFVVKPFRAANLAQRLSAALKQCESAASPTPDAGIENFIGTSPAMQAAYQQIRRVAVSKAPVFVTGESGTGKEVSAQAIHARSACATGPFIALNCSAIPRELMESEIFGHVKGAFTGAHEDHAGAAELAHGGTLLLDEICEMDLSLQAKLLRFIQTGTLRRVGDTRERAVDVRFVCATNRDPAAAVATGTFREDLFYRLHVLPLALPPLRERAGDVLLLARSFLARFTKEEGRAFAGFEPEAEAALEAHPWPGNVRELQNVIRRVVVLHDAEQVTAEMLALPAVEAPSGPVRKAPARVSSLIDPLWRQERKIIETALAAFGGNTARAAAALEISPSTIYRKLQAWSQGRTAA